MLRDVYHRTLALAARRGRDGGWRWWRSPRASFFPIPPDVLLVPMALARPERAWRLALICTIASVCGGALGYFIGYACSISSWRRPVIEYLRLRCEVRGVSGDVREMGVMGHPDQGPDAHSLQDRDDRLGRGEVQFLGVHGGQCRDPRRTVFHRRDSAAFLGRPVKDFIERRLTLVTTGVAVGIVGGFVALRLF
jgi:hypothetical protein